MKRSLLILFILTLCIPSCHAQFGLLNKLYKGAKSIKQSQKQAEKDFGNTKIKDLYKEATIDIDTTSAEYKERTAEIQQKMYDSNPYLKNIMELQGDTAALNKYIKEQFSGMSNEDIAKKVLKNSDFDYDSKEFQNAKNQAEKMSGLQEDPLFKKVMAEGRTLTKEEALYFNKKYGANFEYDGMEAYNDSVGVYAHINGNLKPMGITIPDNISEEKPTLDFGQDEIKKYVQDYISFLKKPFADREIVDSVQNYMIYNHRHAEEQFKGEAEFTIYSNLELSSDITVNDMRLRKLAYFTQTIDPNNILVFKVRKGVGCRYMEYMYSKITYKQSELTNYVSRRLIDDGYIDANINKKLSDDELFKEKNELEYQFKIGKLLKAVNTGEKFMYTNVISAAKGVSIKTSTRRVGVHVTALDINIKADPGEYAFIIRNPDAEEVLKHVGDNIEDELMRKKVKNWDISLLNQGAFFFTIK